MARYTPIAIAIVIIGAPSVYFGLFRSVHDYKREVSQEERKNEATQTVELPKAPIRIAFKNSDRECVKVENAYIDGDNLLVYVRNQCGLTQGFTRLGHTLIAADGTRIGGGMTYIATDTDEMEAGERREVVSSVKADPRTVEIKITVRGWLR